MHTLQKLQLALVLLFGLLPGLAAGSPPQQALAVIGAVEHVTILPQGLTYPARIDTGATTTSIHAVDITQVERRGEQAVRFSLVDPESREKVELTLPLVRVARIKRHGTGHQKRMVVRMRVALGSVEEVIEVTLTDRAKYTFPLLVGRNLLKGRFLVDVSREYTTASH